MTSKKRSTAWLFVTLFLVQSFANGQESMDPHAITPVSHSPNSNFQFGGRLDFRYDLIALPTARRGHTEFDLPEFRIFLQTKTEIVEKLKFQYDFIENRMLEASVQVVQDVEGAHWTLAGGILLRPWYEKLMTLGAQRSFAGPEFYPLVQRYKYDGDNDKGISLARHWQPEGFSATLAATNGEGGQKAEGGSSKDFNLILQQQLGLWQWMLGYTWGAYDEYSGAEMRKERIQGFVQYQSGADTASFEILYSVDPQQAIFDRKIAEGVDLTARPGERIMGLSSRLFYHHQWSDLWGGFFQFDSVKPDVSNSKKAFWEGALGLSYRWNPQAQLWTGVSQATFPEEHSASIRDQQRFSIAMRLVF